MRAAPAAIAALLVTTAGLTACGGGSGGSSGKDKPADQIQVCLDATLDAQRYVPDIRSNLELARPLNSRSGPFTDPMQATYIAQVHADVNQWRLHTSELEAKDITPELRKAMDTLIASLEPLESQTENSFYGPPTPDSTMEVYQAQLENQLCK
ncbi:hypothetical protein [Streptomyces sp. NRRL F-5123]|uniref:hypothetical protein n=1 Tax=Streptomyces sp. NRRL F-5123 TaxID=1463856 RepID=UPI0004E1AA4C|nr:hypothetical protein [Streptomyces sp. NRRL F-5123]